MRGKKGVEITMNTIIVAIIALIVLVVLAVIFTNNFGKFNKGTVDCINKGGEVLSPAACKTAGGAAIFNMNVDGQKDMVCCLTIFDTDKDPK